MKPRYLVTLRSQYNQFLAEFTNVEAELTDLNKKRRRAIKIFYCSAMKEVIFFSQHGEAVKGKLDNSLDNKLEKKEPWSSRWLATPLGFLMSPDEREEWLGDLEESIYKLREKGYPEWMLNVIFTLRCILLCLSTLQIKVSDVFTLFRKSQ